MTNDVPQRLTRIAVGGLFGDRSYVIHLDREEPTVLTGANGTGKSTILRLVNAVSNGDSDTLTSAPVHRFALHFEGLPTFSMRRIDDRRCYIRWGAHEDEIAENPLIAELPEWVRDVLREYGYDARVTREVLMELHSRFDSLGEYRSAREILESLADADLTPNMPDWYSELEAAFQVIFVTDQRLVVEPGRRRVPAKWLSSVSGRHHLPSARRSSPRAVEAASNDIGARMALADSDYARRSQAIDRSFPVDVITAMQNQDFVSKAQVGKLQKRVDQQRNQLRRVGLLEEDASYQPTLESEQLEAANVLPVIEALLKSTERKLEVLQDLARKLTALKDFLDSRFDPKSVELNRHQGLQIRLADRSTLRPGRLSSGEQQMIVLAYEILFAQKYGTLVIIDEPEISLHVRWQARLIADLVAMGAASRLQFLMATHSPVILGEHSHLERSLDELT